MKKVELKRFAGCDTVYLLLTFAGRKQQIYIGDIQIEPKNSKREKNI